MAHDRAEKIMQLHHMGLSVTEIAREIYVAKEQVTRVIEEHGERPTTSKQRRVKAARIRYEQDILTPLERRRKALKMSEEKKDTTPLTPEKIAEVQKLVENGTTIAETAAQAGVSVSSVCRIKKGKLTDKKRKPAPTKSDPEPAPHFTTLETASPTLTDRDIDLLRQLIDRSLAAISGAENGHSALGKAYGLLTAAQLILGGEP